MNVFEQFGVRSVPSQQHATQCTLRLAPTRLVTMTDSLPGTDRSDPIEGSRGQQLCLGRLLGEAFDVKVLPKATGKTIRNAMSFAAGTALYICHRPCAVCDARDHVWHVHAHSGALGEDAPSCAVHTSIPRGTLRLQVSARTGSTGGFDGNRLDCRHRDGKSVSSKQTVVALSSGQSELYGVARPAAFGIQTRQLLQQLGVPLRLDILCDTSSSKSCGCRRHCETMSPAFESWTRL